MKQNTARLIVERPGRVAGLPTTAIVHNRNIEISYIQKRNKRNTKKRKKYQTKKMETTKQSTRCTEKKRGETNNKETNT